MSTEFHRGPGRPRKHETLLVDLAVYLRAQLPVVDDGTHWPSAKYRQDPQAFCRDVLGIKVWAKQIAVLEAVRDNLKVAVSSGNKCGKTKLAAIAALWYYCSFPDARVWITAATARTVTRAIWREIRKMHRKAKIRIDGEPAQHAGSGLVSPDLREIIGFTATAKEDAAGTSGENIFYIVDEASGVADAIFEAIEGNRAGGQIRVLMISNPTQTEGQFYRAFHEETDFWVTFTISGEETPNAIAGEIVIPGLASREWIDEMARLWGREDPRFKQRVLGLFTEGEEGKIFPLAAILRAEELWRKTEGEGPLVIGLDPAGSGVGGDETVFAPRRGRKILDVQGHRGLTEQGILVNLLGLIERWEPNHRIVVTVVLDEAGKIGAKVYGVLWAASQQTGARFRVVGVRSSDNARRQPLVYHRVRDELWGVFEDWVKRDGGAIPEHVKLAKDLHAVSWSGTNKNLLTATDKDELRKMLGRSPDYGDACCLSTWMRGDEHIPDTTPKPLRGPEERVPVLDPRAGLKAFDPYRR